MGSARETLFTKQHTTQNVTAAAEENRVNEQQKKRAYDERIREVEHASFTPLIFSTSGGVGPAATIVYRRLATLIAEKQKQPYSRTLHWLRCKLSFSLLRLSIMCLRGARSSIHHPAGSSSLGDSIDLHYSESKMLPSD